jgi:plasmid replication initiation protein
MSIDPVYIKSDLDLYTKIANFIASKDQGNYVRTEKEYKNLFNSMNLTIKTKVYKGLLRIPFFHNVMYISHK